VPEHRGDPVERKALGAPLSIRTARPVEAEAISRLIQRTVEETNSRDYDRAAIEGLKADFSPQRVERRMRERLVYVATLGGELVGTASLAADQVHAVFVDPTRQRAGIGAALMAFIERLARHKGLERLVLTSSKTAVSFYRKLGYDPLEPVHSEGIETLLMQKALRP
jgi:GNAT superfamily N-acetyltransferase